GFNNPRPQIDVPYSDDSLKSKRWLRRNLPENEIIRSVQENQSAKLDDIVKTGIMQVYKLGLKELEEEFLQERCALIEEKTYHFIGLCASYRGILSFTDWDANCFVTPYSDSKKYLLESRGYQYVESMIKVPYSLINEENCHWLAEHIPGGEWKRTEKEIKEDRIENGLIKAKKKIEDLGLEELPEELLSASAACEKNLTEDIGIAGSHNGILSFTDPMGVTRVTPATREKVELLKSLNYQFMGAAVRVPYSLKTESNIAWLRKNIAPEYWDTAKEANREELKKIEQEQTEKRRKYFGLKDLPDELLDNSIQTDQKEPAFTGSYYQRNGILAFVDPAQILFITPVTRKKKELLEEAGYKESPTGFRVPYSDGTPSDIEFIQMHLSGEEFESSRRDQEKEEEDINKKNIEKILSSAALDKLSRDILARSAKTSLREIELIGHYCSRGGVTCFIYEDGFFYVTMTVPWKEQALREAGYTVPEQLIRVPYGSGMEEDLLWLENNLPDEDME
ncbi:MAG: hypothetical protein U9N45_08500, partial [Gemmatimonadota bacterium]|nr:hypothetical protein [Gemmatimonadota bacterium]